MTANRFRPRVSGTGPLEEATFIEVLFSGSASPVIGWTVERPNRLWRPPTDVYETEDNFEVLVEMAGARPEDLSLIYAERRLTITGVRHDPSPPHRAYHQLEMQFGEFRVDVDLPAPVTEDHIDAHYQDGFLRVILPKVKTQTLPIK
jgi:HSP20 family molecular chaperone IbpA